MYAQSINLDLNGRGISDSMADKAVITTGSESEEAAIFLVREASMRLTNSVWRRRVTLTLSVLSAGVWSGQRERASGPAKSFPGTW